MIKINNLHAWKLHEWVRLQEYGEKSEQKHQTKAERFGSNKRKIEKYWQTQEEEDFRLEVPLNNPQNKSRLW